MRLGGGLKKMDRFDQIMGKGQPFFSPPFFLLHSYFFVSMFRGGCGTGRYQLTVMDAARGLRPIMMRTGNVIVTTRGGIVCVV